MKQLPLFYRDVVPLNQKEHCETHLDPDVAYSFCATTNSVYISAVEFPHACHSLPIVFAQSEDEEIYPAVLLGLRDDENVVRSENGIWKVNYVPAYIRRYPFILADNQQDNQFTVCIDKSYSRLNQTGRGFRLFNEDGAESQELQNTVEFLKDFHQHVLITRKFCQTLKELDLLEPVRANVKTGRGEQFALSGMLTVSREKIKKLDGNTLETLNKNDYLELISAHLISLGNLRTIATFVDEVRSH